MSWEAQPPIFSTSASFFTDINLIAVVGEDFPEEHLEFLRSRGIDLEGLERRPGKTFRWKGEYSYQLNEAHTLETHLNVLETFRPKIPSRYNPLRLRCFWATSTQICSSMS